MAEVASLGASMERLRDEICELDGRMLDGSISIPLSKQPLLGGFYLLPEQSLRDYEADRQSSFLANILACTKQLMTQVDHVVIIGEGLTCATIRVLFEACCQPYFNQLSRGARGSRPRLHIHDACRDNDFSQGLLQLLNAHRRTPATDLDQRWALVVIDSNGRSLTQSMLEPYLRALLVSCAEQAELASERIIWIAPPHSMPAQVQVEVQELPIRHAFGLPSTVGAGYDVMTAAGLAAGALMGINIMQLQAGATNINELFRSTKSAENPVLQYAAIQHLSRARQPSRARELAVHSRSLAAVGDWYRHLVHASLEDACLTSDLTAMDSWPLSRLRTTLHVQQARFDPIGGLPQNHDGTSSANQPEIQFRLPVVDETRIGQLFQLLMLATVVEARLSGRNPYSNLSSAV